MNALRGKIKHLTIVPTGHAALVPWPALPTNAQGRMLVDDFSVSLAPSFTEFLKLRAGGDDAPLMRDVDRASGKVFSLLRPKELQYLLESAVVAGNPAFAIDPQWRFHDLPGALQEASFVAELVKTPVLTGAAATKAAVLQALRAQPRTDLPYLATHAVSSESNPLEGGFLALAAGDGEAADGSRSCAASRSS